MCRTEKHTFKNHKKLAYKYIFQLTKNSSVKSKQLPGKMINKCVHFASFKD